ncbi:MAG TPA: hypothetical protein VFT36_00675, partial [Methylomirabilota bacterium]|nr:hypothetical protein [Methylomirabilota bacterium]
MTRAIPTTCKRSIAIFLALTVLIGTAPAGPAAAAEENDTGAPSEALAPTPPRLSYTDGDVSFWRP